MYMKDKGLAQRSIHTAVRGSSNISRLGEGMEDYSATEKYSVKTVGVVILEFCSEVE